MCYLSELHKDRSRYVRTVLYSIAYERIRIRRATTISVPIRTFGLCSTKKTPEFSNEKTLMLHQKLNFLGRRGGKTESLGI